VVSVSEKAGLTRGARKRRYGLAKLKQALINIISNSECQDECCDRLFLTMAEYDMEYSKLTGLLQALDQLQFIGLVTYNNW
jgi:hypothetical protein